MGHNRALALASVSAAGGMVWRGYRRVAREVEAHDPEPPDMPGRVSSTPAPWGTCTYRIVEADTSATPWVLIHGWGRTADSAWWPIFARTSRTVIAVDLPGHGDSTLNRRFELEYAVSAVELALQHAGFDHAALVGHSLGGAVALCAARKAPKRYSDLVIIASSAHWLHPRLRMTLAAAPFLMSKRSPLLIRSQRNEVRNRPYAARHIAWSYACRPPVAVNRQSAAALRQFDARLWTHSKFPPITWVVTTEDGIIDPRHQRASARLFGAELVEMVAGHSIVIDHPDRIVDVIESATHH